MTDCGAVAEARSLPFLAVESFESVTGKGVKARVDGRGLLLGNRRLLEESGIDPASTAAEAETMRADGQTVMFVAVDGKLAGLIGVADPIKTTTPEAIRQLHKENIRIVMLTGDSRTTAQAVASRLGIDDVVAEVLPEDKSNAVKRLQDEGRFVAMAGDGINDAPALAKAQIGIAMGTGTDVAMESAGVTLVKGDLGGILRARRLSRATMRNIKENLLFAFIYNALGVPIAAGVLYPFFGLMLSPMRSSRHRGTIPSASILPSHGTGEVIPCSLGWKALGGNAAAYWVGRYSIATGGHLSPARLEGKYLSGVSQRFSVSPI